MYKGRSILAVIPARGGSKGILRKNIKMLGGKPMLAWSIEAAQKSKYIDRIIVSTEDEEIAKISLELGAEVPFMRPEELAMDTTPGVDPILYTIKRLEENSDQKYDFILLLQPTSPLRNEAHIDESIEILLKNLQEFDSLISVTELEHPVYWNRIIDKNKKLSSFIEYDKVENYRRQDFDVVYRLNGAIYLIDTNIFIKYKNFETEKTMAYVINGKFATDVDCMDDFQLVEYYMSQKDY